MSNLLSIDGFVKRDIEITTNWRRFVALLAVADVASQKLVETEKTTQKRKSGTKRCSGSHESCDGGSSNRQKRCTGSQEGGDGQNRSSNRRAGPEQQIPDLPERFRNKIESLEGTDVKFLIQKQLYASDENGSSRMSIPKQVRQPFLTEDEIRGFDKKDRVPLKVLIEPSLNIHHGMVLNRWEMRKEGKPSTYMYALIKEWRDVRERNGLGAGDEVQVWSFRIQGKLCLALVKCDQGGI